MRSSAPSRRLCPACTTTRHSCGDAMPGGAVEDNGPCASVAEHEWGNLGDKPLRSLSAVSPPAVRTRAHHVVAIHEHGGFHGLVHVACGRRGRANTRVTSRQFRPGGWLASPCRKTLVSRQGVRISSNSRSDRPNPARETQMVWCGIRKPPAEGFPSTPVGYMRVSSDWGSDHRPAARYIALDRCWLTALDEFGGW